MTDGALAMAVPHFVAPKCAMAMPSPLFSSFTFKPASRSSVGCFRSPLKHGRNVRISKAARSLYWKASGPEKVELENISGEDEFNTILSENAKNGKATVIEWMASWCRKCIYLKPKLEKLAAEFYPNTKFYYVDVNAVSKSLVKRAGITKMPTIQLWKNNDLTAEVIGGHQAWLVLEEIREMLKQNAG